MVGETQAKATAQGRGNSASPLRSARPKAQCGGRSQQDQKVTSVAMSPEPALAVRASRLVCLDARRQNQCRCKSCAILGTMCLVPAGRRDRNASPWTSQRNGMGERNRATVTTLCQASHGRVDLRECSRSGFGHEYVLVRCLLTVEVG